MMLLRAKHNLTVFYCGDIMNMLVLRYNDYNYYVLLEGSRFLPARDANLLSTGLEIRIQITEAHVRIQESFLFMRMYPFNIRTIFMAIPVYGFSL